MPTNQQLVTIGSVVGVFLLISFGAWFFVSRTPTSPTNTTTQTGLGGSNTKSVGVASGTNTTTNQTSTLTTQANKQKVFKIADGPVTGATFIQTFNPTTTLARYIMQENGHVLDQPIDVPGSLARASSNTTIPGTARALWGDSGRTLYMQYIDNKVVKTVSLIFPPPATAKTGTLPVRLQFFPDGVVDIASSPSGEEAAYLLKNKTGVDGYISKADGSDSKKLFSLGLSDVLLSWPSSKTLLVQTKSAADVPGIVFSVDTTNGNVIPLIYASGITAIADYSFSNVVYQTTPANTSSRTSYIHNVRLNTDVPLSLSPIPEKCVWSTSATSTLYCATPTTATNKNYIDQWHSGLATAADSIISFNAASPLDIDFIAVPGSSDGGQNSDVASIDISPDGKYLLFVKKGDSSLWGVRLTE